MSPIQIPPGRLAANALSRAAICRGIDATATPLGTLLIGCKKHIHYCCCDGWARPNAARLPAMAVPRATWALKRQPGQFVCRRRSRAVHQRSVLDASVVHMSLFSNLFAEADGDLTNRRSFWRPTSPIRWSKTDNKLSYRLKTTHPGAFFFFFFTQHN